MAYRGLPGAFPYAVRASDSWLFRAYAIGGGLLAAGVAVMFLFALVDVLASTSGAVGGTFTFVRAFFLVVALLVLAPIVAPVLLVARRHRRTGNDRRYDAALAVAGFTFVASLAVGLVASVPPGLQQPGAGPVVGALYAVPAAAALAFPVAGAAAIAVAHRLASES